jgi:hypothetical protein
MDPLPVKPVVLDYAIPAPKGEFRAHWAIRVMLLAGIVAFFVPLTQNLAPMDLPILLVKLPIKPSTMEWPAVLGLTFGFASAAPLCLLAIVPVKWQTLSALVQYGSSVAGSLALAGCAAIILRIFSEPDLRRHDMLALAILIALLICGGVVTLRAILRQHSLPSVSWLFLSTTYAAIVGCWLAIPEVAHPPQIGYWLTLVNLIAVVIQSVRTVRAGW